MNITVTSILINPSVRILENKVTATAGRAIEQHFKITEPIRAWRYARYFKRIAGNECIHQFFSLS